MRTAAERPPSGARKQGRSYQLEMGTRSLLAAFFALAVVCALFFSFGYTIGKHAVPASFSLGMQNAAPRKTSGLVTVQPPGNGVQPPNPAQLGAAENNQTPAGLTAAANSNSVGSESAAPPTAVPTAAPAAAATTAANPPAGAAGSSPAATGQLFQVQVFAGSQADSNTLASALEQKGYPARVVAPADNDPTGLFRVQVGPYLTRAEAEAMRSRLTADGYQAVIKN